MRLGFGEVLVVLALALLFFGPSKLPQLGSSLGQALKSFKKGLNSLHDEVEVGPEEQRKNLAEGRADAGDSTVSPASTAASRERKSGS